MPKTYLIYPRILKGFAADLWQANRRQVKVDPFKRQKLDGIKRCFRTTVYTFGEVLCNGSDEGEWDI